jgi:transcriptional regulator with XRE-family HTH domain
VALNATLLGNRIRDRRTAQKISQKDLATEVGVSPSAINQYEKGEKIPSTSTLIRLAEVLDVSSDYLLGASDKDEIFLNKKVAQVFKDFMTLNRSDRMQIMSNINFLKEHSRRNPLNK